jgi:FkbM family methyltransferase
MTHKFWGPNGELSQMILKGFQNHYQGYAVDVGASDGVSINTTIMLEKNYRWTVLSVEPNPYFKPFLHANRAFVEMCACGSTPQEEAPFHIHLENPEAYSALNVRKHPINKPRPDAKWSTIMVPVRTVDQLLAKWEFPRLDVLCVDTEGTEVDVLKGCELKRWKPTIIVVECWDKTGPTHEYLREQGYRCADTSVHNYVYLREVR